jgi:hypothetical protein
MFYIIRINWSTTTTPLIAMTKTKPVQELVRPRPRNSDPNNYGLVGTLPKISIKIETNEK